MTIDKNVLPPNVVLTPAIIVLDVAVLQLRQRGQRRRRRRRQQLRGRRRRAERLDGLRVLVLHGAGVFQAQGAPSLITHRERRGRRWRGARACVRGGERRASRLRPARRRLRPPKHAAPPPPPHAEAFEPRTPC
ncbi:unnamed protein product [Danaus chrysippus]|uniref:(African queen) hypothetical protein n=1 Tax=Danaus chrysippus TaxID=151541 RepID=A0A8J2MEJ9_9NEOP|nr:unnamed protein product [Danaus chrysippus]